jgi:replicative superfamily II helicase
VTEKVKSLKEFGKRLGFDVEGYFQNNGKIPMPKDKPMIAICTIEKANVLINSLIEEGRLNEIGLVVFDEMHMLGDPNRGYLLEILGTKIKFAGKNTIQMVGMSATMPNLGDLAKWIGGVAFSRDFRPVQLVEHVFNGPHLLSTKIHHPSPGEQDQQTQYLPKRLGMVNLDPLHFKTYAQGLGVPVASVHGAFQLVRQLLPHNCALVFCHSKAITTKLAIEFAARLSDYPISKDSTPLTIEWFNESAGSTLLQPTRRSMSAKEFADHMQKLNDERLMLVKKIRAMSTSKSISSDLEKCLLQGVAWHNADLGAAERELIEAAFRTRTIGVICCTSTLAAGVNLPARRVILMSNKMGPENLSIREYRQMVGRAGRAGIDDFGESFLFITPGRSAITEHAAIHLLAQSMEPVYSCLKDDKSANDFSAMRSARHALDRRSKSDPRIQTHPTPFRLIPGATNLYFPEEPIYSLFCVKLNGLNMNTTGCGVDRLVLDAIGGRSAVTPWEIFEFVGCSFLAATLDTSQLEHIIMKSVQFLRCLGFVEKVSPREANQRQSEDPDYESGDPAAHHRSKPRSMQRDYTKASFHPDTHPSHTSSHPLDDRSGQVLVLSTLGAATYRTSFSIETAIYTHEEISKSLKGLDLTSDLQLCWLVAPVFSRLGQWGSHFETWLELLNHLTSNQRSLAERVGVEASIFCSDQQGMVKPSSFPAWQPTQRFFMALILQDVVDEMSMVDVALKYGISAGDIEGLMTQASQHAGQLVGFCKRLGHWHMEAIFKIFALRVGLGVKQEIIPLMKIRGVKGARARLLYKKGYQSVRTIANAEPHEIAKVLSGNEDVSSTKLAKAIIRNAKAFLDQAATELRTTAHSFAGPSPQEPLQETRGVFTKGHQQKASKPSQASHIQHYEESQTPHNEALPKQTEVEREMDLIKGMWDYDPYMSDDDDLAQAEIEFALMDQM